MEELVMQSLTSQLIAIKTEEGLDDSLLLVIHLLIGVQHIFDPIV
jgi:hypothetical protein